MLAAAFTAAINAGDVPAALELWLGDGALAQPDGTALRGRGAIESALQALVDNRVTLEIAIVHGTLTLNGVGFDGEPYSQSSDSVVVYQRGPEGWRIAIDAPWGLPAR
jgi:ketosteroid isomerase-like protein